MLQICLRIKRRTDSSTSFHVSEKLQSTLLKFLNVSHEIASGRSQGFNVVYRNSNTEDTAKSNQFQIIINPDMYLNFVTW